MPNVKVISKGRPARVDAKASITLLISNNYIAIFPSVFSFIAGSKSNCDPDKLLKLCYNGKIKVKFWELLI